MIIFLKELQRAMVCAYANVLSRYRMSDVSDKSFDRKVVEAMATPIHLVRFKDIDNKRTKMCELTIPVPLDLFEVVLRNNFSEDELRKHYPEEMVQLLADFRSVVDSDYDVDLLVDFSSSCTIERIRELAYRCYCILTGVEALAFYWISITAHTALLRVSSTGLFWLNILSTCGFLVHYLIGNENARQAMTFEDHRKRTVTYELEDGIIELTID